MKGIKKEGRPKTILTLTKFTRNTSFSSQATRPNLKDKVSLLKRKNSLVFSEYGEIVLSTLIFIVNPIMNLMGGSHHKCERKKHHFSYSENSYYS